MSASSANSVLVSKIYKSRNIILDLLKKRGFNTNDYEGFSINEVHIMNTNKQLDLLLTNPTTKKKVYVNYRHSKKISPGIIHEMVDDLFNVEEILDKNDELIIITKDKANDTTIKLLRHLYDTEGIFINVYNIDNFLFNILEHTLVHPHRVLNKKEKQEVFKKYNISNGLEIPEISRFDPVALAIGLRPNELCEIIRPSTSSITSMYYRICKA
jgi:DNA-directed RNA polymerase subunit H (RpoH/RPB5)